MVWPCIVCRTVFVCPQSTYLYLDNDMIFWIFLVVHSHAFCMWHWPIRHLDLSYICGQYHVHLVDNWPSCLLFYFFCFFLLPKRADETQPGQNSWPRLQFVAFNSNSIDKLPLSDARVLYLVISLASFLFHIL